MSDSLQERAIIFMKSVAGRSGDPFYTVSPPDDFRFVFVNDAACRHFGRSREELLALRLADVNPACPPEQWQQFWDEIRAHGSIFFETLHRHVNGFDIPVAVSANFFAQGQRELFGGCIHDLREQRRAEDTLRESEEMLRTIFNSTYDAILLHAPDGRLLDVNATFLRMHGIGREQALALRVADFASPAPELAEALWAKVLGGEPQLFDWKGRRYADGTEFDVEVYLQRVRFRGKAAILANLRDITARKQTEEALQQAKTAAEQANRLKSELLANTSHELRTPMTVIMGSLEYMLHTVPDSPQRELLEMADKSAQRLLAIIEDLLDISRIEGGRLRVEKRPFTLRKCVDQALAMVALLAREKGLDLACEIAPEVPPRVVGDPARIGQVLLNLIGNAVKFTDHGKIAVTVTVEADRLLFSIQDTGIGIPAGKLQEIFEPFAQVDASGTRRSGGTGLGLTICRELVQAMAGEIWATSEEKLGSTFFFTLPLITAAVRR